ncbi:hypothetical protein HZA85_00625 [Candidatus Uhrbacteria bacterium]|nr:hypothetical protein [Candidatus Uhrbacteria bacterium]
MDIISFLSLRLVIERQLAELKAAGVDLASPDQGRLRRSARCSFVDDILLSLSSPTKSCRAHHKKPADGGVFVLGIFC